MITDNSYQNDRLEIEYHLRENEPPEVSRAVKEIMKVRLAAYDTIVGQLMDEFNDERYLKMLDGKLRRDN